MICKNFCGVWTISETEFHNFIDFANFSTQPLSLHPKCYQNILFSLTLKFLKDHVSFKVKHLMFKHILSQQKHFNTHISPHATLSVLRRASLKKKKALRLLRTNSVKESFELKKKEFLTYRTRLPSETRRNNPSRSSFRITQNGFTK